MMPAARQEQKDRIEQAIALGWTFSRIMRVYGYDHELIKRVWDLMVEKAAEQDKPARDDRPRRNLSPCGTRAAAERHHRRGEPVDDACREAARLHRLDRKDARKRRQAAAYARATAEIAQAIAS